MNLEFFVRDKRLTRKGLETLVGDTQGHYTFTIDFDREWENLVKVVVFRNGPDQVQLRYTGQALIPPQVCGRGDLYVAVHGYRKPGDTLAVIHTVRMTRPLRLLGSGPMAGDDQGVFTPTLFDQVLAATGNAEAAARQVRQLEQELREKAEQGDFQGVPGPAGPAGETGPRGPAGPKGLPGVAWGEAPPTDGSPIWLNPRGTRAAELLTRPMLEAVERQLRELEESKAGRSGWEPEQFLAADAQGKLVTRALPLATDISPGCLMPRQKAAAMTQPVGMDPLGRLFTAPGIRERVILDTGELPREVSMLGPIDLSRCRRVRIIGKACASPTSPSRRGAQLICGTDLNRRLALDAGRGKLFNRQGSPVGFCVLLDRWKNTVTALSCSGFNADDLFAEQPPFSGIRAATFDGVTMLHTEALDYSNLYLTAMDDFANFLWGVGTRVLVLGEEAHEDTDL